MAAGRYSGRRRFITREHTSDTSEADTFSTKTPEKGCEKRNLDAAAVHRIGDAPSAFVRVKPALKNASLKQSHSNSTNGLNLNYSSQSLPQSALLRKNSGHHSHFMSQWSAPLLHPTICTPMDSSPGLVPDNESLGFRPIRRDSIGSESSSLAGSTVDSELTIANVPQDRRKHSPLNVVKPPSHPSTKDPTNSTSRHRPWSQYDLAMPLSRGGVRSSLGSASSYDNLDKLDSLLPTPGRDYQSNSSFASANAPCSSAASRTNRSARNSARTPPPQIGNTSIKNISPLQSEEDQHVSCPASQIHGSKTYDATRDCGHLSEEDKGEIPHFLEGVCRRRIAGGHVQVIPPHLVGVFDPSRFIPAGSHAPYEAGGDRNFERPYLASTSTSGKALDSMPFNNPKIFDVKSRETGLMNTSSNFACGAMYKKPTIIRDKPAPPCGSGRVELSSSENEVTYSFENFKAAKQQSDNVRARVFDAKVSEKASNSVSDNYKKNADTHNSDLPLTDLFHYTLIKPGIGPSVGQTETQERHNAQMAKTKATFSPTVHSSPSKVDTLKHASPSSSKSSPKWNSSPAGSQISDLTSSSKGSPKWEPPKLSNEEDKREQSFSLKSSHKLPKEKSPPGISPNWQYSPLTKSGQAFETTLSPAYIPKYEQTSNTRGCPRVERVPSVKTSPKYDNARSPKGSPKAERNSLAKCNLKLETSQPKEKTQPSFQSHDGLKWEATRTHLEMAPPVAAIASRTHNAEPSELNARMGGEEDEKFRGTSKFSQLHSSSAIIQVAESGAEFKNDGKEEQKQADHLPSVNTNTVFFTQKEQFLPPSKCTSVDKYDAGGEKLSENPWKFAQNENLTMSTTCQDNKEQTKASICDKTDVSKGILLSAEKSDCPQKVANDIGVLNDFYSDKLVTVMDVFEPQHNVIQLPLVNVQNENMTRHNSEEAKVSASQTVNAVAVKIENNSKTGTEICASLDNQNSTEIKDKLDVNFVASDFKESILHGNETTVKDDGSYKNQLSTLDELHGFKNVTESSFSEAPKSKSPCPQTKMFTDIRENIQVITQPCIVESALRSSTPVDAFCMTAFVNVQPVKSFEESNPSDGARIISENSKSRSPSINSNQVSATDVVTVPTAADALNNNHPKPENSVFCSNYKIDVSNNNECFIPIDSSSTVEDLRNREATLETRSSADTSVINRLQNISVSDVSQTFPSPAEKAIFTLDKEITFVSRLIESPEKKQLSPTVQTVKPEFDRNSVSASQDNENLEEPVLCMPVSASLASPPTDVFVTLTVPPLLETPSAFQKSDIDSIDGTAMSSFSKPLEVASEDTCIIPTCEPLSPPIGMVYNCRLVTLDSVQIPATIGEEDLTSGKLIAQTRSKQDKMFDCKSCSDSVDQAETNSRGSTASFEQVARGSINISKSPAVYQTSALPITLQCSSSASVPSCKTQNRSINTGSISQLDSNATLTEKVPTPGKCNLLEWPNKITGLLEGENMKNTCAIDALPVMAALDDALAVLTSVVMDRKISSADVPRQAAVPVKKSTKESSKQDRETISSLHSDIKKGLKPHTSAKEGPSKKKSGVAPHKERGSPAFGSHHSDPLDTTDVVRQEIQTVENRRQQLVKEDSFNRPDSPMFHDTLPLPKDSIIKRNRKKFCDSSSSSSDGNGSPQASPRFTPRSLRRCKRSQNSDKSSSLPASEVCGYRTLPGRSRYSSKSLSRHNSDIFLNAQSSLSSGQRFHKSHSHGLDFVGVTQDAWPKLVEVPQGAEVTLTNTSVRDGQRRSDRVPLRSDIQDLQQSLLLYNQQHGGRRGQSWTQTIDVGIKGQSKRSILPTDRPS